MYSSFNHYDRERSSKAVEVQDPSNAYVNMEPNWILIEDLIKGHKLNKPFKEINLENTLNDESLNSLSIKDIWKLSFANSQLNQNISKLKKSG